VGGGEWGKMINGQIWGDTFVPSSTVVEEGGGVGGVIKGGGGPGHGGFRGGPGDHYIVDLEARSGGLVSASRNIDGCL